MNALTLRRPGETQEYAQSWIVSVMVHGLALGLSMLLIADLRLAPQPESFKWDVAVVESPAPKPGEAALQPPPPPPAAQPPVTPQPPTTRPHETPRPVQTVQAVQTPQTIQRVVRNDDVREAKKVIEAITPAVRQQTSQPLETVSRTAEPLETTQAMERPQKVMQASASIEQLATMPSNTSTVGDTQQVVEAHPLVRQSAVSEALVETVRSQPVPDTTPLSPASAVISQTVVEARVAAPIETPAVSESVVVRERSHMEKPTEMQTVQSAPIQEASIREHPLSSVPRTKADYGWLADALWSKVEQLKRYPAIARMNRWEGKVVIRAVITDNGEVAELEVTESSGHAILDRDAVDVLKRASPLRLKHALGQSHVVVHVPISYALRQ